MRFMVVGGNNNRYDFPRGAPLCGFDGWGDVLCSVGMKGFYIGARRLLGEDYEAPNLVIMQVVPQEIPMLADRVAEFKKMGMTVVVEPEGVSGQLERYSLPYREKFVSILRQADIVLSLSYQMTTELELWSDNVHCIGHPVDVKAIKKLRSNDKFQPRTVWCGSYILRIYRDILMSVKVVHDLGLIPLVAAKRDELDQVKAHFNLLGLKSVQVIQSRSQEEFLANVLPKCSAALQMCSRTTIGRTAAECACLGIQCFGTKNYFQVLCFPDFIVSDARGLRAMPRYISHVSQTKPYVEKAWKRIKEHSHKKLARRLLDLVEEVKK